LREFNTRFGRTVDSVAESVMEKLRAYKWPGNVRELRNLMEATFVNEPDRVITENDLPEEFRRKLDPIHEASAATAERERLLAALAATNWNKSKAAGRLQWSRVTLYRKMAKYHLAPDSVNPVNVQVDTE
jgi:transcriptional regulator of acetoin/glycerol metabolism